MRTNRGLEAMAAKVLKVVKVAKAGAPKVRVNKAGANKVGIRKVRVNRVEVSKVLGQAGAPVKARARVCQAAVEGSWPE